MSSGASSPNIPSAASSSNVPSLVLSEREDEWAFFNGPRPEPSSEGEWTLVGNSKKKCKKVERFQEAAESHTTAPRSITTELNESSSDSRSETFSTKSSIGSLPDKFQQNWRTRNESPARVDVTQGRKFQQSWNKRKESPTPAGTKQRRQNPPAQGGMKQSCLPVCERDPIQTEIEENKGAVIPKESLKPGTIIQVLHHEQDVSAT